jgi:hypothetical protein
VVHCPDIADTLSMQIEMHHYTFVRRDISCKMRNVSNRDNHDGAKVCWVLFLPYDAHS